MDRFSRTPAASTEPLVFNPTHASLPIDVSGGNLPPEMIPHAVPISRLEGQSQASQSPTIGTVMANNPMKNNSTVTTTYALRTDPSRDSNLHENSRPRRSTVDNYIRPVPLPAITVTQQERPIGMRPDSLHHPFQPDYNNPTLMATTPWPDHHYHLQQQQQQQQQPQIPQFQHQPYQQYPYQNQSQQPQYQQHPPLEQEYLHTEFLDHQNLDIDQNHDVPTSRVRLNTREIGNNPLRTQLLSSFTPNPNRPIDTQADDYGEDGYGYTNPRDLVQYDLDHSMRGPEMYVNRGLEGNPRPRSLHSAYDDLVVPRTFDSRERGPPPSTRGFDRIRLEPRDHPSGRNPTSPTHYHHRPSSADVLTRPRSSSRHSREPPRSDSHDEVHHSREYTRRRQEKPRRQHHMEKYDDGGLDSGSSSVEHRGFGVRSERSDRSEMQGSVEHRDQLESGPSERREFRGREMLATGLSLASAALGVTAVRNASRDDSKLHGDREGMRRKEIRDETRRHRERYEEDSIGSSGRDSQNRDTRSPETGSSRNTKKSLHRREKSMPPPSETSSRDSKERARNRDDQSGEYTRRQKHAEQRRHPLKPSQSESSGSEEVTTRRRREYRRKDVPSASPLGFNPNDTTDLKALQRALNSQESSEQRGRSRPAKDVVSRTIKETANQSKDRHSSPADERESQPKTEKRTLRVVSPPREKVVEEKPPVKGILRQPREKFPEDPAPVREGVAPLKDAKKDGIPPDARWTKINRRLVNPEALEMGKERYEARDDFVIVLRVLTKEEVQAYADLTQKIRGIYPLR